MGGFEGSGDLEDGFPQAGLVGVAFCDTKVPLLSIHIAACAFLHHGLTDL